ncbi:hypothetical protein CN425_02245 [Bacillus cereus]|uniref:Uncharacterized protein n=1 Tax=Bacillus cereus TaxID=1396 RepID=A0A2A8Q1Q1_BACCE|nr:hypothetical protein [Bacillus cereus]EJS65821.1 hypothetical protein ICU_03895 [Bacillus cereus BAG2X1-1]PEA07909.1 hypothetical protein CON38_19675 [Bacillus cereus]PEW06133.1 hypothetical protein CN425_02245 [Bacillus cereus]PFI26360.1 hypothetical protein COI75_01730 [Bacillus cereus]
MRKKSCTLLIEECEELLGQIDDKFRKTFENPENIEVAVPKVKTFLEHCRSILEYTAQDIFELVVPEQERIRKLKSRDNNVYFPYGSTTKIFRSSVSRSLPGLMSSNAQVYSLVEGLQDYKRDKEKEFLTYMCRETNYNKHDDLSENERQSTMYTQIGSAAKIGQGASVLFQDCVINGVPTGTFSVENGQIRGNINPRLLGEIVQYEEGQYVFKGTKRSVVQFLQFSLNEIKQFVDDLYKILESRYV